MYLRSNVKKYSPYLFLLLFGLVFLAKPVRDLDEIWNYGFANYIAEGLRPYADFNMIQTPLSAYLAAAILSVFGNTLLVFRILGAVLFLIDFGVVYKLSSDIINNRSLAFVLTVFFGALLSLVWMYNYNHLNLMCILLIIYCEYRMERRPSKRAALHWLVGLLYGITPVIKQSTGAVLVLWNTVWCVYAMVKKPHDRKQIILRLVMSAVPVMIFVVWLSATGLFADFYDYAVVGICTFTHRDSWINYILTSPIDFVAGVIPLGVTACSVYTLMKGNSRVSRAFHAQALLISWAGAAVAYPICDFVHVCVAIVPFLIPMLCCVGKLHISKSDSVVCCCVAALVLCCSTMLIVKDLPKYTRCTLPCFRGVPISCQFEQQIKTVDAYLTDSAKDGVDVIIADKDAAAYMLPAGKYYKNFNLLLVGNVGSNSVDDLLQRGPAIYLVKRDNAMLGNQAHTDLIMYIKENYTKIGEVAGFDAYIP